MNRDLGLILSSPAWWGSTSFTVLGCWSHRIRSSSLSTPARSQRSSQLRLSFLWVPMCNLPQRLIWRPCNLPDIGMGWYSHLRHIFLLHRSMCVHFSRDSILRGLLINDLRSVREHFLGYPQRKEYTPQRGSGWWCQHHPFVWLSFDAGGNWHGKGVPFVLSMNLCLISTL